MCACARSVRARARECVCGIFNSSLCTYRLRDISGLLGTPFIYQGREARRGDHSVSETKKEGKVIQQGKKSI